MDDRKVAYIISVSAFIGFFIFVIWFISTNDERAQNREKSRKTYVACGEVVSKSDYSINFRFDNNTCKYMKRENVDMIARAKLKEGGFYEIQGDFIEHGCFVQKVLGVCDEAFTKRDE